MATEIGNPYSYPHPNIHLDPYLAKEYEVQVQCAEAKIKLKEELLTTTNELANKKTYSPIEAKTTANATIKEKLDAVIKRMKEKTTDVERQELIDNTWRILSAELYSPFEFKKTLEETLRGEALSHF